jgi:hypothetical protein
MTDANKKRDLKGVLFDMEEDINSIKRFAEAVRHMGQCNEDPPAGGVYAVGSALEDLADSILDQWNRAIDLAKNAGGSQ